MARARACAVSLTCVALCVGLAGCEVQEQYGQLPELTSPKSVSYHQQLAGSVVAAGDGRPLAGAVVEIVSHPNRVYIGAKRQTDPDGAFDFGDVRSGLARAQSAKIEVEARAAGFVARRATVTVRADCSGATPTEIGCRYAVRLAMVAE